MGIVQTSAPSTWPITLDDLKEQTRVSSTAEDSYQNKLIARASRFVEDETDRQFIKATWRESYDRFPKVFRPCRAPLMGVSGITYVDSSGSTVTLSSTAYDVDTDSEPGRIVESHSNTWPATRNVANAVKVTYFAGYGTTAASSQSDVPETSRHAVTMLADHWFENREPVVVGTISSDLPLGFDRILQRVRYHWL